MPSVRERVYAAIQNQLSVSIEVINDQATLLSLGGDSLDHMELVLALEEDFEFEIPDADTESIHTVGQLIVYLEKRVAAQPS